MHVQLNKKPKSQIGSDYHHEVETNKHLSLEERAKKYGCRELVRRRRVCRRQRYAQAQLLL